MFWALCNVNLLDIYSGCKAFTLARRMTGLRPEGSGHWVRGCSLKENTTILLWAALLNRLSRIRYLLGHLWKILTWKPWPERAPSAQVGSVEVIFSTDVQQEPAEPTLAGEALGLKRCSASACCWSPSSLVGLLERRGAPVCPPLSLRQRRRSLENSTALKLEWVSCRVAWLHWEQQNKDPYWAALPAEKSGAHKNVVSWPPSPAESPRVLWPAQASACVWGTPQATVWTMLTHKLINVRALAGRRPLPVRVLSPLSFPPRSYGGWGCLLPRPFPIDSSTLPTLPLKSARPLLHLSPFCWRRLGWFCHSVVQQILIDYLLGARLC